MHSFSPLLHFVRFIRYFFSDMCEQKQPKAIHQFIVQRAYVRNRIKITFLLYGKIDIRDIAKTSGEREQIYGAMGTLFVFGIACLSSICTLLK